MDNIEYLANRLDDSIDEKYRPTLEELEKTQVEIQELLEEGGFEILKAGFGLYNGDLLLKKADKKYWINLMPSNEAD